jgi:hypothetical protein
MTYYSGVNFGGTVGSGTFYPGGAALAITTDALTPESVFYAYYGSASYTLIVGSLKASAEL